MKKKGFTLVELLAIIVIIGIIALVATPILLKIIREAKKQAFLDTSYGIVESGYNYYSTKALKGEIIKTKETIKFPEIKDTIKVKGKLPDSGTLEISKKGNVAIALYNKDLNLCAVKEYTEDKIRLEEMEIEECTAQNQVVEDSKDGDMWAGWITLNLYYPENSEERMWRLDSHNGTRNSGIETWQNYTGPITIPIDRVEDIYIKYKIKGKTVIVGPKSLWVDIEPSSYKIAKGGTVTAKINYEETADKVEYRVGRSSWQEYTGQITVKESTVIEARVTREDKIYSSTGEVLGSQKVTEYDSVYIRDASKKGEITSSEAADIGYKVNPVTGKITNSYEESLKEPTINITPETKTEQVTVSITTEEEARKIYVKVGNSKYREYDGEFEVSENTNIYAYYIKEIDGTRSNVAHRRITNIVKKGINNKGEEGNLPWVNINAEPYPTSYSKLVKSVMVTLETDADEIEYSYDGIEYYKYKEKLKIEENKRIYARATNEYGETEEYLDITNIGEEIATPAKRKMKLDVSIAAKPEPELEEGLIDKTTITITYDKRATKKYYRIGYYGNLKEYTGPFELKENKTIYAYALSSNGEGETSKQISNLTTGIAEPKIITTPTNGTRSQKVKVKINYDKNAVIKKYRINNGNLIEYEKEFEVSENSTIYAININELGQRAESKYEITNIVENMIYVLDKGEYFIIKLNYPEESKEGTREYKYGKNGTWEKYKQDGIMLIKGEYKDKIKINSEIEITDENGNKKIFNGDKYYVEGSINDIKNDIFMRWDTITPTTPKITINPTDATKKVETIIDYGEYVTKKEYKIVTPDSKDSGWKTYKTPIIIDKKNTIIYARSQNASEMYSEIAMKKITNIDEEAPVIKLGADLETKTQSVLIKVNVTDDVKVDRVMYAKGLRGASYFSDNGEVIPNNSMVKITENGTYTFYAVDGVGNEKTYSIIIENIDNNPPKITISVEPELTLNLKKEVTIDYGDSKTKKYKIGKETKTWTNYTDKIELDSYTVIANKQVNSDLSVTVCAEGIDSVGNVNDVCKNIYNLDLDIPETPKIVTKAGYPVLTENGVKLDGTTTITYDKRKDIDNYYSLDGTTWTKYTGNIQVVSGTVYAKSVKKDTGLEVKTSMTVAMPKDALGLKAYDNNNSTSVQTNTEVYMKIDVTMQGKKVAITGGGTPKTFNFYNSKGEIIKTYNDYLAIMNIPYGAVKLGYKGRTADQNGNYSRLYEIRVYSEPQFNVEHHHPKLTEYGINNPYDNIMINYFTTAVTRLYKINDGEWKNYTGKIKVEIGDTIYAKGIDKNNNETVVTSYKSVYQSDIEKKAYDGNTKTYYETYKESYMDIDQSMKGKKIAITGSGTPKTFNFYNSKGEIIKTYNTYENPMYIPSEATKLSYYGRTADQNGNYSRLYEMTVYSEPQFNINHHHPKITEYGIEIPYDDVTIDYFKTSTNKLYKINDGEWKIYTGKIRIEIGDTIYAKSYDQNNTESIIASYKSVYQSDIEKTAYDGNTKTYYETYKESYMDIDQSMKGKKIAITGSGTPKTFNFYNSKGEIIKTYNTYENPMYIPSEATKLSYYGRTADQNGNYSRLYEMTVYSEPQFNIDHKYPTLTEYGVTVAYDDVTIDYFKTSTNKLYKINDGEWKTYTGKIRIEIGDTIYAKSYDQNNTESIIASYKSVYQNDIEPKAYDNNNSTYFNAGNETYIYLDQTVRGKNMYFYGVVTTSDAQIKYYDSSDNVIETIIKKNTEFKLIQKIPTNAVKMSYRGIAYSQNTYSNGYRNHLTELRIYNEPVINIEHHYPELTTSGINVAYDNITIDYFNTSTAKQYKINSGEWKTYTGKIRIEIGDTIYARGTDKNGTLTNEVSYKSVYQNDVEPKAYDNDKSTFFNAGSEAFITINSSMRGKYMSIYGVVTTSDAQIKYYDSSDNVIETITKKGTTFDLKQKIPDNAVKMSYRGIAYDHNTYSNGYRNNLNEIGVIEE